MPTPTIQRSVKRQTCQAMAAWLLFFAVSCHAGDITELFAPDAALTPVNFPNGQQPADQSNTLRVAFLGNTLIHRDAEYGFTETELTRRAAGRKITFRNLGWPGDTVSGSARIEFGPGEEKSGGWQRPDNDDQGYGLVKIMRHLGREAPHIVIIGYGSNVAFAGQKGLEDFERGLDSLLEKLKPTGTRVVLLSPPPRDSSAPFTGNLADQNRWIAKVSDHLSATAKKRNLRFIDLFNDWPKDAKSFADNGIHLNEFGYRIMGRLIADDLIPVARDWNVSLVKDGQVASETGARSSSIVGTKYGMRWRVRDELLPSTLLQATRTLSIAGLESGTYSLDVDGRRVARGTAREFSGQ